MYLYVANPNQTGRRAAESQLHPRIQERSTQYVEKKDGHIYRYHGVPFGRPSGSETYPCESPGTPSPTGVFQDCSGIIPSLAIWTILVQLILVHELALGLARFKRSAWRAMVLRLRRSGM